MRSRLQPGDIVIHSNKYTMLPSVYFDRALPQVYVGDVAGSAADTLAPATQVPLGLIAQPDIQTAAGNAPRVWYVAFQGVTRSDAAFGWLEDRYRQADARDWGTLRVFLFVR